MGGKILKSVLQEAGQERDRGPTLEAVAAPSLGVTQPNKPWDPQHWKTFQPSRGLQN